MMWFCGGHGSCLTDPGDPARVEEATIAWLDRWLAGDRSVKTGPGFDWINQDGERFATRRYPKKHGTVAATGKGSLPLTQAGGSGPSEPGPGVVGAIAGITNGTRALNAVNVKVEGRGKDRQIVGIPKLSLRYSGTATGSDARAFAQLVDDQTNVVLGNQVTPLPLKLDGKVHTLKRPLEAVAHTLRPGSSVTLQLTSSATNWGLQRAAGLVDFKKIEISLPTVKPGTAKRK